MMFQITYLPLVAVSRPTDVNLVVQMELERQRHRPLPLRTPHYPMA